MSIISSQLIHQVDPLILAYLDTQDLNSLSQMSKKAYLFISTGPFFENLFKRHYSCFFIQGNKELNQGFKRLYTTTDASFIDENNEISQEKFQYFTKHHPLTCWKVACKLLKTGQALSMTPLFINEAIDCKIKSLKEETPKISQRLKEICSNGNTDHNSPLNQASAHAKDFEKRAQECQQELETAVEKLEEQLTSKQKIEEAESLRTAFRYFLSEDLYTHLVQLSTQEPQLAATIAEVKQSLFDLRVAEQIFNQYKREYDKLDQEKNLLEKTLSEKSQSLNLLESREAKALAQFTEEHSKKLNALFLFLHLYRQFTLFNAALDPSMLTDEYFEEIYTSFIALKKFRGEKNTLEGYVSEIGVTFSMVTTNNSKGDFFNTSNWICTSTVSKICKIFASQPLEKITSESCTTFTKAIASNFLNAPEKLLRATLSDAIKHMHGIEISYATPSMTSPSLTELP